MVPEASAEGIRSECVRASEDLVSPGHHRSLQICIIIMLVQKRVEAFLRSEGQLFGLVGPPGSGKLYTAERAAAAVEGFLQT